VMDIIRIEQGNEHTRVQNGYAHSSRSSSR
jgi:hypothetical protein